RPEKPHGMAAYDFCLDSRVRPPYLWQPCNRLHAGKTSGSPGSAVFSGGRDMVRKVFAVGGGVIALLFLATSLASAQITTGTVAGSVKDPTGLPIPGATVVLVSETRGTKSAPAVTNETGDYVFPNVLADSYTVEVTLEAFKTVRRSGVAVSGGDRTGVGTFTLEPGANGESAAGGGRFPPWLA